MAKDVFEITVKLTVERDGVPGMGHTSQSWLNFALYDFLKQSHYNAKVEEVEAKMTRNGKMQASAKTCELLDKIVEVQAQEWLEAKRLSDTDENRVLQSAEAMVQTINTAMNKASLPPYYYVDENGAIREINAFRTLSGISWNDGVYYHVIDEANMSTDRIDTVLLVNGEFTLYKTREEIEAIQKS